MAFRKIFSTKCIWSNLKNRPIIASIRNISNSNQMDNIAVHSNIKPEWDRVLTEAEQIVNHQPSLTVLNYLTSDDYTDWSAHIKKINETEHPMNEVAKALQLDGHSNIFQTWGLIVLLVSKMAGISDNTPIDTIDSESGLLKNQKVLAEIVEMNSTANLIHSTGVFNMQHLNAAGIHLNPDNAMQLGNKLALLAGDILMGYTAHQMGKIRNHDVNELLCTAARDVSESHFIEPRDHQNFPMPSDPIKKAEERAKNPYKTPEIPMDQIDNMRPFSLRDVLGSAEAEWNLRHTLEGGTLLGKSCQAAIIIGKHPEELQKEAYFLGKHIYLAWQAANDLESFTSQELPASGKFRLISGPLLFQLEYDPSLYDEIRKGFESIDNIDYAKLHKAVREGPGIEETHKLLDKNCLIATTLLHKFPPTDARTALEKMIVALQA